MISQPLKNKRDTYRKMGKDIGYYKENDVASAVKYFKYKLKKDVGLFIDNYHYKHSCTLIDEAFADVVKEK